MDNKQIYSRDRYLALVAAAIKVGNNSFGRDSILYWLGNYPGDLEAGLLYARVLINDEHYQQAIHVLLGLLKVDPEYAAASSLLIKAVNKFELQGRIKRKYFKQKSEDYSNFRAVAESNLLALGEKFSDNAELLKWGLPLYETRQALKNDDLIDAEASINQLVSGEDIPLLAIVTHLQYIEMNPSIPVQSKLEVGESYLQSYPDCLVSKLLVAHWLMRSGKGDQAVVHLHEAAARDISGQVSDRLFEGSNPYKKVWPEKLELSLNFPIPGEISAYLGWNQLMPGLRSVELNEIDFFLSKLNIDQPSDEEYDIEEFGSAAAVAAPAVYAVKNSHEESITYDNEGFPRRDIKKKTPKEEDEITREFREEIEKIAKKRKFSNLSNIEGRFPVYVVFSMRSNLVEKYGETTTKKIVQEMDILVSAIQTYNRWEAVRFLADIRENDFLHDIPLVSSNDPWNLKLALTDLDHKLAARGQMIGALLIVGGPEIISYHKLPNPVDDQDELVPSDNPYGTSGKNYFVPEWPVGRLPGGIGSDGTVLINQLQRIANYHAGNAKRNQTDRKLLTRLFRRLGQFLKPQKNSYGYTAAVWKKASYEVYKPIGKPKGMFVSPPLGFYDELDTGNGNGKSRKNRRVKHLKLPKSRLGYFNLHGLIDAPDWYGQNDPKDPLEGPDYPVAIRPIDIGNHGNNKSPRPPEIVFSEACYGAHVTGKSVEEAISLQLLSAGCRVVVGSTCMSYGSIRPPLIAADLLGKLFWNFLCEGYPVGEAFKHAKLSLAYEMDQRQGYLDGEDQKTLISFIMLGDPLDKPYDGWKGPKSVLRPMNTDEIETICDRNLETDDVQSIPEDVLVNVQHVVKQYLPGMANADVTVSHEKEQCNGDGHTCPTSQRKRLRKTNRKPKRSLITLNKTITKLNKDHPSYARLTMDDKGKLVKLAVSR